MIPYGRQSIDDDDVAAVVEVLRSDFLTTGPAVERFEAALCEVTGARFAVAVANGTAALHAACAAAEVGPGQKIATSALTFNASAACVAYVGGTPALVDIDPATWNLDLAQMPSGLDGVVAVHYAGMPLDLSVLPYRPRVVIEDASHALGAVGPDGPVGNCARSDMCTFSFHPVKPITTAEGGAVTTNDPDLAERLRRFRNHGIERMPEQGGWYYEVVEFGYNYRLNDVQAALGASQIRRLESFVERRNILALRYRELLSGVRLPPEPPLGQRHGRHLSRSGYPTGIAPSRCFADRASVFRSTTCPSTAIRCGPTSPGQPRTTRLPRSCTRVWCHCRSTRALRATIRTAWSRS